MNDKDYYARLREEMEKKKAAQPSAKKLPRRKSANVCIGKSMKSATAAQNNITSDDIVNLRIAAETSEDVLDFIRRI